MSLDRMYMGTISTHFFRPDRLVHMYIYIYIWLIRTKYMYTIYSMYVYTYVYTSMKVIFLKQNLTDAHCSNLKFINFSKQSTNLAIKKYIQAGKNTNIFLIN